MRPFSGSLPAARVVLAALLVLALAGCAGRGSVPPITASDAAAPAYGKFVFYELLTEDRAAIERFYGELFGWSFSDTQMKNYRIILHDGRAIGGVVDVSGHNPDSNESQWLSVLSVPDVDAAVDATRAAGGEIFVGAKNITGRGRMAVVGDPQGAPLAFLRAEGGDPPDDEADYGEWLWTELWTSDVRVSAEYYEKLVGFEIDEKTILEDTEYTYFSRDGVARAGVIPNPYEQVHTNWLPYVRVKDPAALAGRVEELGGKVVLAPADEIRNGSVAIVADPSGAVLALQQWPVS